MQSLTLKATVFLILIIGLGAPVDAQKRKCSVTVSQQTEAGNIFYGISGDRFGVGQEVRIEAVNRRTGQGLLFFHTTEEKTFSGIFIGKDPDGFYYRISPGLWTVTAKSDTCTAKTEFGLSGVPLGTWGGNQVLLSVNERGANFTFTCSVGEIAEPLAPDVNGNLEVKGTVTSTPPIPGPTPTPQEVVYRIWTDGHNMRVTIITPGQPEPQGGFDLVYGQLSRIDFCP